MNSLKCLPTLKRNLGFSLLEIMVALVLSSVIIGGTLGVFVNTKKSQRFTSELSQLQESGRFALEFIKRDVRMVGYQGCNSFGEPEVNIVSGAITLANFQKNKIQGFEVQSGWSAGTVFSSKIAAVNGTDAISIARVTDLPPQNTLVSQTATQFTLNNTPSVDITPISDMFVLVSDCQSADLFKLQSATVSGGTNIDLKHGGTISKVYEIDKTKFSSYRQVIYYIGDTGRKNNGGESIRALYQSKAPYRTQDTQELIEGVENMQILYGETLATGNVRYVPANQATPNIEWANVQSVKISLLLTTNQAIRTSEDSASYQLLDTNLQAPATGVTNAHSGGQRLKKVFSTTVNIRNRVD